jgi:hypothetical protein
MDTDIPGSSTKVPLTNGHLPVRELGLGLHTPYKPNKVENLKKFRFDKATNRIVQQTRKLPVTGGNPLSVVTKTLVTKDIKKTHSL